MSTEPNDFSDFDDLLFETTQERLRTLEENASDRLSRIGQIGAEIADLEQENAMLEAKIKENNQRIEELATRTLPDLLREVGIRSFDLTDGTTVELKDEIYPSVPSGLQDRFHEWLRANGHGDLIKHELKVTFGMGEDDQATALREMLAQHPSPLNFSQKETVLAQSLKAWAREMDRRGQELPEDIIKVHRITRAVFQAPKVGGGRKK